MLVIGVDVGRTGARAALATESEVLIQTELIGVTDRVQAVDAMVRELTDRGRVFHVDAVAVGAAGFQMLGAQLRQQVPPKMPSGKVLLCSDMLTSYAGALGLTDGGVVVAAGTGSVALGADMRGTWLRADGWGYLLGDHGSGAWIGRMGMQAGLRASDHRPGGSSRLLKAVEDRFGDPTKLVAELMERPDRSGIMGSFAPEVAAAAGEGDVIASAILTEAGGHLADTATAALPAEAKRVVATTGNLFKMRGPLWDAFTRRLDTAGLELRAALASGVDGALDLARAMIADKLPLNAPAEVIVKN